MESAKSRLGHVRELGRVRYWLIGVGIATLAVSAAAFASASGGGPVGSSDVVSPAGRVLSAFAMIPALIADPGSPQVGELRLASLPGEAAADTIVADSERQARRSVPAMQPDTFDLRFNPLDRERVASFDDRFAAPTAALQLRPSFAQNPDWLTSAEHRLPARQRETVRVALRGSIDETPAERQASPGATPSKPIRLAYAPTDVTPSDLVPSDITPSDISPTDIAPSDAQPAEQSRRTAIYDISARAVYLPNGEKLEAHSGYGAHMDDLSSVRIRDRGVTPPNVYKLTLRENMFHGIRAVRMTPLTREKMHGRDGFLVHPYMLGPDGQSNGCVSINDYPKFLEAFLNGEVDRLMVIERLAEPPSQDAGGWLAQRIKALLEAS